MTTYFFSEIPCYLKIDGAFFGYIDNNIKYVNNNFSLLEFIPIDNAFLPYYIDSLSLKIDFLGGKLVIPKFNKLNNLPYKIITQKEEYINNVKCLLTILLDSSVKFYFEGLAYITGELPFIPTSFKIEYIEPFLFIIFEDNKKYLFVYDTANLKIAYNDVGDNFNISNSLEVYKNYNITFPIYSNEVWEFSSPFKLYSSSSNVKDYLYAISEDLLPYYFLKLNKLGVNVCDMLYSNLKEKFSSLNEFIGNYSHILAYTLNNRPNYFIVDNNKCNKISFSFTDKLISNIIVDD